MSKLKRQVIQALNIKTKNIQRYIKLVYNSYKDNLDNILNNNINDIMASIISTNPYLLRQIISDT